ncbi:hypothetical protein AQ490_25250 [Wenjunlia vitaminophila]|uniref:Uncharacterized protein n=1 Tax=Wenjunlia vitaminophila TaxID=76728 RepID=A0A0T6LQQ1_WENVI|nr:hypothetical protein [Wenjunlia vitaminophila]KRV48324.1 hypothetical protein AQ490_25250 [Wenjunlia vitaminophila]
MLLRISVLDADDTDALRDFFRWLRQDDDAPTDVRLVTESSPGAMGALDVINVTLTHGVGLANFALVYAGWRRARRSRAVLTFTRASDGLSVTVEDGSEQAVRLLVDALSAADAQRTAPGGS